MDRHLPPLSAAVDALGQPAHAGRKRVRFVPDAAVPLGSLWLGGTRRETEGVRWLLELRLGGLWSRDTIPSIDPTTLQRSEVQVPSHCILLVPVMVLRPCLHRALDTDRLRSVFDGWRGVGPLDARLRDFWVHGTDADDNHLLVPGDDDLSDALASDTYARAERAIASVEGGEPSKALRQILARFPAALLTTAGHPGLLHIGDADPTEPVARAALSSASSLHDAQQRRGRRSRFGPPSDDVDLYVRFPHDLRRTRGAKRWGRFIAALALRAEEHTEHAADDYADGLKKAVDEWRKWSTTHWARTQAVWLCDHGHHLEPGEAVDCEHTRLRWLGTWLLSDAVLQAVDFLRDLERARLDNSEHLERLPPSGTDVWFTRRLHEQPYSPTQEALLVASGAHPVVDADTLRWATYAFQGSERRHADETGRTLSVRVRQEGW